jgi:hypothetical protein
VEPSGWRPALVVILAILPGLLRAASVTLEAESGTLGADWVASNSTSPAYISITSNFATNNPVSSNRVATYSVNFPAAGTYELYARLRLGPDTFNDDSLFFGNGFGTKSPTTPGDWYLANGIGGFASHTDVVTGGGTATSGVWKWINLSQKVGQTGFAVTVGNLAQILQIGAREDGLDIDKLVFGTSGYTFTVAELDAGGAGTPPAPYAIDLPPNVVAGNLIQFNENGAWCWYQDERAVVDTLAQRIILGSVASGSGTGGGPRDRTVDGVIFDLADRRPQRSDLAPQGTYPYADDHDAPAFVLWPNGRVTAQYAGHNNDFLSRFRTLDGDTWSPETSFDWTSVGAVSGEQTSYSNPHYLPNEGRAYSFVRCIENRSPHFLVTSNMGATWNYGGQLVEPDGVVGYNSGYFRYSDNGADRIDFICTEGHPRDLHTSIYHGYISNGMSFQSDGTVVDTNLFDQLCPVSRDFTLVFSNGTVMPDGMTNYRCWNSDVQRYADGTVQAIIHARINNDTGGNDSSINPNHSFFFCRYDGTNWATTYLCQAGTKMYSSEADYVGLGALSPNDPKTIFISTRFDPRAVTPGVIDTNPPFATVREIWKGVTTNRGMSFMWTMVTSNSVHDNFRPIVPAWNADDVALLWFRGTYSTAQSFDSAIVGLVERRSEVASRLTYVDATTNNTTLADGTALVTGDGAGQWHLRTSTGNGGDVLASADILAENAPALRTTFTVPEPGTYDVWANFWGNPLPGSDWRVMAGTAIDQMQVFRQMASRVVQPAEFASMPVVTNQSTNFLYQAYLGRVTASASNTISVFIDDHAAVTGSASTLAGITNRTWYDGASYAQIEPPAPLVIQSISITSSATVALIWNSRPAESLLAPQTYSVQRKLTLNDTEWTTVATGILSQGDSTSFTDTELAVDTVYYRISMP